MDVNRTCKFEFSPVYENKLINIIDNLHNTGPSYDGLPMVLFKGNSTFLSGVITRIWILQHEFVKWSISISTDCGKGNVYI